MDFLYVLILAVVQGIAEFLPISSSGHLSVLGTLFQFNPEENLALGIVLHAGTLVAIVVFYFRELLRFLRPERFRLALMVILGSVPAGIIGVTLKQCGLDEAIFSNLLLVGCGFLFTATLLLWSERKRRNLSEEENTTPIEKITPRQAVLIGLAQAIAILPGISRSGSTIATGLFTGVRSAACAEFSFLLAIPAIGGAALLELLKLARNGMPLEGIAPWQLGVGFGVSAVVGYAALALLVKMLNRGKLALFSWYLYAVGLCVLIWQLYKGL